VHYMVAIFCSQVHHLKRLLFLFYIDFDLDSQDGGPSYFPEGSTASPSAAANQGTSTTAPSVPRRSSIDADELAANTMANAGRRASNAGSAASSGGGGNQASVAVGLDSVDMAASGSARSSSSRSPSFTLPNSRRSSAAGENSRAGVREEMRNRDDTMQGVEQDEDAFGEGGEEDLDPEGELICSAMSGDGNTSMSHLSTSP
jgi:hypothetical protein